MIAFPTQKIRALATSESMGQNCIKKFYGLSISKECLTVKPDTKVTKL